MKTTILAVGLTYILIGFFLALIFVFVFRRTFFGHFWGAALVAIIGAFAGGVFDLAFHDIVQRLTSINGIINIFPPTILAGIVLSLFARFSESKDTYDR